jgi:hypothetical protein
MKDQYFGDINDFRKYGLLRSLADGGSLKIGICWMLTPDDGRSHGSDTNYLDSPNGIDDCDSQLFRKLRQIVKIENSRSVFEAENNGLIPLAVYRPDKVPELASEREAWLRRMLQIFRKTDLVFFDPDNGIEVKSKPWRTTASPKHLYWREIEKAWQCGHSLLIYQHFPRVERDIYVNSRIQDLKKQTNNASVFSFYTSRVVFLLVAQLRHLCSLHQRAAVVRETWRNQFKVTCV